MQQTNLAGTRSEELTCLTALCAAFWRRLGPQILVVATTLAICARLWIGDFHAIELAVIAVTMVGRGPVEWAVHKELLHAPLDAFTTRKLGLGIAHRQHHADPGNLEYILLRAPRVLVFLAVIALGMAAWILPLAYLTGTTMLGLLLTGIATAWFNLVHYEWTHLMLHSRHELSNPYYKRLERSHRLHHFRNERHWLGVTSQLGDRIAGTLPTAMHDVELSPTARRY